MTEQLAIIGGTGAMGRGLAVRLARSGVEVVIGSRDAARGAAKAEELSADLAPDAPVITGTDNASAARAPIVVLAVPFESLEDNLDAIAASAGGAVVVSMVNPLGFDATGPHPISVPAGSVAEHIAARIPTARVVSAFNTVASPVLNAVDEPVDEDILVAGDDAEAVETVIALANRLEGARGVAVGALRLSSVLESLTPVLIGVNKRYRTHAGVRFSRLEIR